ncbi:MAG: hypothetical protein ACFFB3_00315, partial [Candidatus Hodarchaeota archaeon]
MIKKRSFWLAVFILGAFLFSMPSLGVNSASTGSSKGVNRTPVEIIAPTYQQPNLTITSPIPHSTDNVTIDTGSIVSGTWDTDGDNLYDWFYINVSITVLVTGPYFAVATLNYSNPDPTAGTDDIPALAAFDWDMYSQPGGDGPGATFGEIAGPTTRTLAFRGDHINATGVQDRRLNVTSIGVADVTLIDQEGVNPVIGQVGDFPLPGTDWKRTTAIYTTDDPYNANDFEPWEYAFVYENEWSASLWNVEEGTPGEDGKVEYLILEAKVNSSGNLRVYFEVELEHQSRAENIARGREIL